MAPLGWPVLAFGLALVLATAFSVDPRASLWGSHERQQGLLTLLAYLALFFYTAANLRTRTRVERLWRVLVCSSAPVVVYGLLQALELDPFPWRTDAASPIVSTIGRSNFLGSYLVLTVSLTLGRVLVARRRWPYLLLLLSQLAVLALTQARGAWVGLGVALVVFGLAWSIVNRDRRLAAAMVALVVLAATFVGLLNWPDGPLAPLARLPGLDRLATITRTSAGSPAARLTIWRSTLPLILDRPWLGYGPETMSTIFARVFPPQLVYYQGRNYSVDRAHNIWLDLAMSAGLVGAAAFAVILIDFGRRTWNGLRGAQDRWLQVTWVTLAAAVAGHLADLQFGFDLTASAVVFWLLLAMVAGMSDRRPDPPPAGARIIMPHLYLAPALVVLALIGLTCLRPLWADIAYWQSRQETRSLSARVNEGSQAVHLWPLEPEYRLGLAWALFQSGDTAAAEDQLSAAHQLSPDDVWIWAAEAELYAVWGQSDPDKYHQAEAAYRHALALAPDIAAHHAALGVILARLGQLEAATMELERAVALDATDGLAYESLADLYEVMGRAPDAAWARGEAARWTDR
jgi:O-antigen ligase